MSLWKLSFRISLGLRKLIQSYATPRKLSHLMSWHIFCQLNHGALGTNEHTGMLQHGVGTHRQGWNPQGLWGSASNAQGPPPAQSCCIRKGCIFGGRGGGLLLSQFTYTHFASTPGHGRQWVQRAEWLGLPGEAGSHVWERLFSFLKEIPLPSTRANKQSKNKQNNNNNKKKQWC